MSDDVTIPEDAPRWAYGLFVGGHLRDTRLTAIEEQCKAINARLDNIGRGFRLDSIPPQMWVVIFLAMSSLVAAALGVEYVPPAVTLTEPPPVTTAAP